MAVQRWKHGQLAAAQRQRDLMRAEGPDPQQAVAEALDALDALESAGLWPGPRDAVSERAVIAVRDRWARIQRNARAARTR
jgi:hypothetical protein